MKIIFAFLHDEYVETGLVRKNAATSQKLDKLTHKK